MGCLQSEPELNGNYERTRSLSTDYKETSKHLLELWGDNALQKSDDYLAANYVNHQMPDAAGGTSAKSLD